MARTDAVQFFLELAAEWRRLGAEVTFEPGWERRGNGMSPAYIGGVVHHTATASSAARPNPTLPILIGGRSDLSGPLCNVTGPWCPVDTPRLHVVAAFPANHAGASGGKAMGPLPVSTLFNRMVVGLEIDYAGLVPMVPGQLVGAHIFARGLANVLDAPTEVVRAHFETSVTGKWDIGFAPGKSYDMAAFRRDAAAYQGDDMPSVSEVSDGIANRGVGAMPDGTSMEAWEAWRDGAYYGYQAAQQAKAAAVQATAAAKSAAAALAAVQKIQVPAAVPVALDPAVLKAALTDPVVVAALAKAVNDDHAVRMQSRQV